MSTFRPLSEAWVVSAIDAERSDLIGVPATVPGCVHTDLLAANLIPDPYLDRNEDEVAWIGRTDWKYETTFDWAEDSADRVELVCDGLDTIAAIVLNGTEIARTFNMHRGYRFDVKDQLVNGPNHLAVRFDSAYAYAFAEEERLGPRPSAYAGQPFNFIRKMACNFGWDWGPTLVTAGIWQRIGLLSWRSVRLDSVRPEVTVDGDRGRVTVRGRLIRSTAAAVTVTARVGGASVTATTTADEFSLDLAIDDVQRWWPRGYGDAFRYQLDVALDDDAGQPLDTWSAKIGFRSVRLDTADDAIGSAYTLYVNDQPIWIRGVNWIPDDCFLNRVTRDRLAERFTQATEANVNYLRVWGGGRYESEDFYDLADELGLMVGQDFLFACAAYPEEEPHRSEVFAEAEQQIVRLSTHPSLVTWTGNNENIWGHADWDWDDQLRGQSWGAGYYYELLPALVGRLDPTRPYWPGSPYSGDPDRHPNDPKYGSMHIWDVWNVIDYTHYRDYVPRLAAEFGYQGPPTYSTITQAISDGPLAPDSPGMTHHQKAEDGDHKLQRGLDAHLPVPRTFDDWHFLTQVDQARAVRLGIEHFRSHRPTNMGAIVWQLNDCWPVTSWAAVDGYGRRKPLWYSLRDAFADRILTIQPRDGDLAVVVVNDTDSGWSTNVAVSRYSLSGVVLGQDTLAVTVAPRSVTVTGLAPGLVTAGNPAGEMLRARASGLQADWFFAEDKDIAYPPAAWQATVDGTSINVTATSFVRDLTVFPDRIDPTAWADRAMVTLLPGESTVFTVHELDPADPRGLTSYPVLRAVNDLPTD